MPENNKKVRVIGDAATELVLTRRCGDVCKVTQLLKAQGDKLRGETLAGFDADLDKALALAAGGTLHPEAFFCLGPSAYTSGFRRKAPAARRPCTKRRQT